MPHSAASDLGLYCLSMSLLWEAKLKWVKNEPAHDKTYSKTCVTGKDSDQPVNPPSIARVLVHPSLESPEAVEGTCDQ